MPVLIASGLLLNVTPGPDTLYIVGRGSTQGLRAGVTAAVVRWFNRCVGGIFVTPGVRLVLAESNR